MKKLSKKDLNKKKPTKEEGHWEGKFWCNCMIRGYRKWLGKKRYGNVERKVEDESECGELDKTNRDFFDYRREAGEIKGKPPAFLHKFIKVECKEDEQLNKFVEIIRKHIENKSPLEKKEYLEEELPRELEQITKAKD